MGVSLYVMLVSALGGGVLPAVSVECVNLLCHWQPNGGDLTLLKQSM